MSAPPIIHVGFHKTGTTWFQRHFYPCATDCSYIPRSKVQEAWLIPRGLDFEVELARKILETSAEGRRMLICDEELSGNMHVGGLHGFLSQGMASRIRDTCPDAIIVIFIRNQVSAVTSAYRQYVRMGGTWLPDRYFNPDHLHPHRSPAFSIKHFDYDRFVRHYEALFGPQQVMVYPYEEFRAGGSNFLEKMANSLDLRIDIEDLSIAAANPSYGRITMKVARGLNAFTRETFPNKHYLVHISGSYTRSRRFAEWLNTTRLAGSIEEPATLLGADIVAAIKRHVGPSNRRLSLRRGLPLKELGYPV